MKYKCVGVTEQISKIAEFIKASRRSDKNATAYKALKELDSTITTLIDDSDNDENYLLTCRRQVRLMLRSIAA